MKKLKINQDIVSSDFLMLINPEHPIKEKKIDLVPLFLDENILLEKEAAYQLKQALEDCQLMDKLVAVSGYRFMQEQIDIWESTLLEHGEEYTKSFVAIPGCSEHQSGLAIDLAKKQAEIDFICPELPYDGEFKDLRKALNEFGFIERYPKGKQAITKIEAEPWHFRYVGVPHSLIMNRRGLVLEEYIQLVQKATEENPLFYSTKDKLYAVYSQKEEEKQLIVADEDEVGVSRDNCGHFVVTVYRDRDEYEKRK